MKKHFFILSSVIILLSACNSTKEVSNNSNTPESLTSEALVNAVLWQQTSAEYDALCYQAFNMAKSQLQSRIAGGDDYSSYPSAVVMDLDETVLDNSPYEAQLILQNKSYTESSWNNWVNSIQAKLVPGAKDFIEFVTSIGLEVVFISNRDINLLSSTMQNLRDLGINVSRENYFLKGDVSSKKERRQSVEETYQIVMLVGDNLTDDFTDEFNKDQTVAQRKQYTNELREEFGRKFIILPNPIYGGWQNALKLIDADQGKPNPKNFLKGY